MRKGASVMKVASVKREVAASFCLRVMEGRRSRTQPIGSAKVGRAVSLASAARAIRTPEVKAAEFEMALELSSLLFEGVRIMSRAAVAKAIMVCSL